MTQTEVREVPALDFKVADLALAEWGRKEIGLAEHEMPGLMSARREYADAQPLARRPHHRLAAHDDPDGGAHRDAGRARRGGALGSCNIFSTQDHAAAAVAVGPDGTPDEPRGASRSSPGRARRSRSTGGAPSRRSPGPRAARTCCSTTAATRRCSSTRASSSSARARCRIRPAPTRRSSASCSRSCSARSSPTRSGGRGSRRRSRA